MNYLNGTVIAIVLIAFGVFMVHGDVSHLAPTSSAGTGKLSFF